MARQTGISTSTIVDSSSGNAWQVFTRSVSKKGSSASLCEESSSPSLCYTDDTSVEDVLKVLKNGSENDRREAAEFIRNRCREDMEARKAVIDHGGLLLLAALARVSDSLTVEYAVTALHNLALSSHLQSELVITPVVESTVHVLSHGSAVAQANAAATIFYITKDLRHAETVASFASIYRPLVELMKGESLRGQKDASYAMCHLTLTSAGRMQLVEAGAVEALLAVLENGSEEMEDKASAVVANLAKCEEGRMSLAENEAVEILGDVLQSKKPRAQEDAATSLLLLANHSTAVCEEITKAGLLPDLVALSKSEKISVRGQQKVKTLVNLLRNQARRVSSDVIIQGSVEVYDPISNHSQTDFR